VSRARFDRLPGRVRLPSRAGAVSVLACVGVAVLFALLFIQMRDGEGRALRGHLEMLAQEHTALLQSKVDSSIQVLRAVASLREVELVGSREEFRVFVRRSLADHPELTALEWVPRVSATDRAAYERAAHDDGYPSYVVSEFNGPRLAPATSRDEYYPVHYVEPVDGNERTLGVDLASSAERWVALARARDSGRAAATAPLVLAEEGGHRYGFLVALPVYNRAASLVTGKDRATAIMGFVVGVFRLDCLSDPAITGLPDPSVGITIRDAETGRHLLTTRAPAAPLASDAEQSIAPAASARLLTTDRALDVGGRSWTVRFATNASYPLGRSHSWWVIPLGVCFTLLFGAYLRRGLRRTAEIERAEQIAARANEAKSAFLAHMSHEIRTPLNAILGYAQILEADPTLPASCRVPVETVANSGRHLLGVVCDILDLSKIEAGKAELRVTEFDLGAFVSEVATLFGAQCQSKGLAFFVDGLPPQRTRVRGDSGKLRQILINLLGNAVKFTERGSIRLRVRSLPPDRYAFEVIDTGIGVPAAAQEQILLPFHQEAAGRTADGTGLGLAIARGYAELMSGAVTVWSHLGEGSRFSVEVRLPNLTSHQESRAPATRQPRRLTPGTRVLALIVDDVRENRDVLSRMLVDLGCEVVVARGGHEAVARARELFSSPATYRGIIFCDVRMPDLDGREVLRRLRGDRLGAVRIVAHSASAFAHEREAYLKSGFDDFLAKPIDFEHVCACLAAIEGVTLQTEDPAGATAGPPARDERDDAEALPSDLRRRILEAARINNATALRTCVRELTALEAMGRPTPPSLHEALRSYDMRSIVAMLSAVAPSGAA
jgi:signal transduction histidine kinase/CheY-like chemotaxis protein